jgi:uncharacterized protein YqjF (DUF2071 family)
MHWPVPVELLRPHVPATLEIETFEGSAWLGVVPFRMSGVRPRLVPPIPGMSAFPELNVRTYVKPAGAPGAGGKSNPAADKPGVWFFSLDATNRLAVRGARWGFCLPYFDANISCNVNGSTNTPTVHYSSRRTHKGAAPAELEMEYRPVGKADPAQPGSLDYFLTERYCLYSAAKDGRTYRCEIAHAPWPLQPADATTRRNTMTRQLGFEPPDGAPLLHYADYQEVVAWMPTRL